MTLSSASESTVGARVPACLSFRDVYRSNYTYVWRSLLRLGVGDGAVDDAVQDTFIVVHRKLDAFEGRAAVRTWLFAIARRVAMRYRDRARRHAVDDDSEADRATDIGRPDEALSRSETLRRLQFWLDELDDDKRAVFVLSEFEQLRAPEIADTLGVNLNTVYARLRAARQHVSSRARRDANIENYRPMLRVHPSCRKPTPAHRRHAWIALSGKLGLGTVAATASGTGLAAGGLLTKLAIAASLLGGGSLAAVAVSSPPTPSAAVASIAPDAGDQVRSRSRSRAAAPDEMAGFEDAGNDAEPEHPFMVPPQPLVVGAPIGASLEAVPLSAKLRRQLDDVSERPTSKANGSSQAEAEPRTAEPTGSPFAAELALFESAKVAARAGRTGDALALLQRYQDEYPRGAFALEAAALRIRSLCSDGRTDAARKEARSFGTRHPASKLVNADDPCG